MRKISTLFKRYFSNESIRHQLLNYSMSSSCSRHPSGPIGWILRDEGIVDIYAGKTRLLATITGDLVSLATNTNFISETLNLTPRGIKNLRILEKVFNTDLFKGQRITAIKQNVSLSNYRVLTNNSYVQNSDGSTGQIVDTVSFLDVFDERVIFENSEKDYPIAASAEILNVIKTIWK